MRRLLVVLALILLPLTAHADDPPIPLLATWEANMLTYGAYWCEWLNTHSGDSALGATQYDAMRVYYQIAAYTGDTATWYPCVGYARVDYRDDYVDVYNGGVASWYMATRGLRLDWELQANADSKASAISISTNGAYCGDLASLDGLDSAFSSREVAHCLNALLDAEALGAAPRDKLDTFANLAMGHINTGWYGTKTYRTPAGYGNVLCGANKYTVVPFMVGITMNALIDYWDATPSARTAVEAAVQTAAEGIWTDAWNATTGTFWYENCKATPEDPWPVPATDPSAPDLNLMIAPAFAWLYQRTADTTWRDRADAIWTGGVQNATSFLGYGGKQFNQNYYLAFKYVTIRSAAVEGPITLRPLSIRPLATSASFAVGQTDVAFDTDCSVVVKTYPAGATVETITSTEGLASRTLLTTQALTAATTYSAEQSCVGSNSDPTVYIFTTPAAPAAGNRTVPISAKAPGILSTAARLTVDHGTTTAVDVGSVQNTSCGSGCTVNLTLAAGRHYYRLRWQDASDNVLATSAVQPISVQ